MNWRTRRTKYSPSCPLVQTSGRKYRTVLTTGRDENTNCPLGNEHTISELAVPAERVLVGNVIGHGIQKTRTTPAGNGKQQHILTFLGGRESVCRIICAIRDCLDTPGMLEDLPVPGWLLILAFGELNEAPKRSSDSEESAIRDFTVCRYPLFRWPILTLLLKLPVTTGQTRTMWSDNIMISYIHVNFVKHFTNSTNRTRTFLLERYMIQSIFRPFPSNISPGGTLHFCHGGTCHQSIFPPAGIDK